MEEEVEVEVVEVVGVVVVGGEAKKIGESHQNQIIEQ